MWIIKVLYIAPRLALKVKFNIGRIWITSENSPAIFVFPHYFKSCSYYMWGNFIILCVHCQVCSRVIMQLQWALHLPWICCVHWCAVFHTGFWMTFHFTASHFHVLQLWSIWWQVLEVTSDKQCVKMDMQCFRSCQCLHHSHHILWIHSILIQLNAWPTFHLL
jgi:hypothetical protein